MRILAFDPSKECTGYALIEDEGEGRLVLVGDIRLKAKDKPLVGSWFPFLMREVGEVLQKHTPDVVAVELPAARNRPWSTYDKQAVIHIPTYGMAVGAVLATVYAMRHSPVLVPVDQWSQGLARGGEHKEGRVRDAAYVFKVEESSFGPKSIAGNMADAALLARWVLLNKVRRSVA